MRLLRTGPYAPGREEFVIETFDSPTPDPETLESNTPTYAILSHRCGDDDVNYEDVRGPTAFERRLYEDNNSGLSFEEVRDRSVRKRKGYSKVVGAMRQAASDGYKYIWIDTCCIDKSNSAELSEGINSMYVWYQKAAICYAILDEVPGRDAANFEAKFEACDWFERGWTLQELLAPRKVVFLGRISEGAWNMLGDRTSLQHLISERTGIPTGCLTDPKELQRASIAQKMSWIAGRRTTKPEDIAYCLLGLFSVNMPLIYGEGPRAFMRLQEEIIKISGDQTIFAWVNIGKEDTQRPSPVQIFEEMDDSSFDREMQLVPDPDKKNSFSIPILEGYGLLATSHTAFAHSGNFIPWYRPTKIQPPYEMTNRGLHISLDLTPLAGMNCRGLFAADIRCSIQNAVDELEPLGIYLKKGENPNHYHRVRCGKLVYDVPETDNPTEIFVRQTMDLPLGTRSYLAMSKI